jgi:hypothetical protein
MTLIIAIDYFVAIIDIDYYFDYFHIISPLLLPPYYYYLRHLILIIDIDSFMPLPHYYADYIITLFSPLVFITPYAIIDAISLRHYAITLMLSLLSPS